MENSKELTICIPTYNREFFLNRLLKSIYSQKESQKIAIVISDNCSKDGTKELIRKWQNDTYLDISLNINKSNLGADKNYFKAINMAKTEYAWLIGSDDWLVEDALKRILAMIKKNDIIISSRNNVYQNNKVKVDHFIRLCNEDRNDDSNYFFNIDSKKALIYYLEKCENLASLFSYISSIVFNSKKINFSKIEKSLVGTYYSHLKPYFNYIVSNETRLLYVSKPLVNNNMGNDSFYTNWVGRMNLDLNGFLLNLKFLKKDKTLYSSFLNVLIRTYKSNHIWNTYIFSINSFKEDVLSFKLWNEIPNKNMITHFLIYLLAIPFRISYFFYRILKKYLIAKN
ncbi:MAG: hypothetical protein CMG00_06340 [Candidatus Marinimicrobia bacterium]|nr:hypothetical protein [Candidatus Neomarinimicrobiota bacterium]